MKLPRETLQSARRIEDGVFYSDGDCVSSLTLSVFLSDGASDIVFISLVINWHKFDVSYRFHRLAL